MIRIALPLAAALSGCILDARVGNQSLSDDDGDAGAEPDASLAPAGTRIAYATGATDFVVDGAHLIMSSGIPQPDPNLPPWRPAVIRWQPGGAPEVLAELNVVALAADTTTIYASVVHPHENAPYTYSLVAIDRATYTPTVLTDGRREIRELTTDGDWLYFGEALAIPNNDYSSNRLVRMAKDGSSELTLAVLDGEVWTISFDDDQLYVVDEAPDGLLAGRVLAVPKNGDPVVVMATGLNRPSGSLVVGDWLYVTERGNNLTDGNVIRVPLSPLPAATPEVLVTGLGGPTFLLDGGDQLYWSAHFSGAQRAPTAGGTAESLASCGGEDDRYPGSDSDNPPPPPPSQGCWRAVFLDGVFYYSASDRAGSSALLAIDP